MQNRSRLVRLSLKNIGCVGDEGLTIELDNIVCLVGRNNAGKSTILRAYELAHGAESFTPSRDLCQWCPEGAPAEVQLEVHIPADIANVDAKWKIKEGDLLIVRSRWQWFAPDYNKAIRTTWDPEADEWAEDGKAGGADNVFKSRLPRPMRIGSLQDAEGTEKLLLTFALSPLVALIDKEKSSPESKLARAVNQVVAQVEGLSAAHEEHFNRIATKVTDGFKGIFPRLDVRLNIAPAPWTPDIGSLVNKGSGLRVRDGKADTSLVQQGTGARRALFWAMLQVHNELAREKETRDGYRKQLAADLKKAQGKNSAPERIAELAAQLADFDEGGPIPNDENDPAFPGYLLLIDEPENALHPMAARAAQRHLYKLAEGADWQVMMTTHSPYFVNPLEDHTTIVRLERDSDEERAAIVPKTYRSDLITFEGDDKKRLQALQHIDPSLAEIFFGSYPILVEGDTEHAAFMASIIERQHALIERVTVIRARGKAILIPLVKVMAHFKIDFGIIHDCDPPYRMDASNNGMWTENEKIHQAIKDARNSGMTIRHRVSIPDFERFIGGEEESKDKPLNVYRLVADDDALSQRVQGLLTDLFEGDQHEPFSEDVLSAGADYAEVLKGVVQLWAANNGLADHPRFRGPVASV
ncbi:ATP-dependent nuclease [Stenotrophomonas sp. PSU-St83]